MKLIYENDIPSITDDYVGRMQDKDFNRFLDKKRWKPNGITDNRKEWRRKHIQHLIEKELEDPFIFNP